MIGVGILNNGRKSKKIFIGRKNLKTRKSRLVFEIYRLELTWEPYGTKTFSLLFYICKCLRNMTFPGDKLDFLVDFLMWLSLRYFDI